MINLGFDPSGTAFTFPKTNGEHKIEVSVRDFAGNESKKEFRWRIQDGQDATPLEKQFNGVGRDIYLGIPDSPNVIYVATNNRSSSVYACWSHATACQSENASKTSLQPINSGSERKLFRALSFNIAPNQPLTLMSYDNNNQLIDIQTLQINALSR